MDPFQYEALYWLWCYMYLKVGIRVYTRCFSRQISDSHLT